MERHQESQRWNETDVAPGRGANQLVGLTNRWKSINAKIAAGIDAGANYDDQKYAANYIPISDEVKHYFSIFCTLIQIPGVAGSLLL